ncbi:STAS/SEC14 domain-containing protein [Polyangium sp. y55x31]|uniref:STAS/SEC14 domain-containing protein n=1 Tax=Polyangium sp. y55x31 TaxID=3042688 RepID=UPI0024831DC5|nr:STAS/SEC14 domain-containing protein [Polyangium sp. y55x31]MDI1480949.1 STAS/SEC14 domain-containing protein [Polyangium sp. y55x31]
MANQHAGFERMGAHWSRREGAILVVRWSGEVTLDDMKAFYERIDEMGRDEPAVYCLFDSAHSLSVTREARVWAVCEAKGAKAIRGIAVVGATFPVRVLGTMLNRATDALLRHGVPLAFFDTAEEGRAYLEAERKKSAALR